VSSLNEDQRWEGLSVAVRRSAADCARRWLPVRCYSTVAETAGFKPDQDISRGGSSGSVQDDAVVQISSAGAVVQAGPGC
jgi:hypothetical protein